MLAKNKQPLANISQAYEFSLDKLERMDMSSTKLAKKLKERECPEEIIREVLSHLQRDGLLNDEEYAAKVYRYWLGKKYYGRSHLIWELRHKEVSTDLIDNVVAELSREEEQERAEALLVYLRKKYPAKFSGETQKVRAFVFRSLSSHGFGSGIIGHIIDKLDIFNE